MHGRVDVGKLVCGRLDRIPFLNTMLSNEVLVLNLTRPQHQKDFRGLSHLLAMPQVEIAAIS